MVDIEYFKRKRQLIELRYNPYHDPSNGRFTSGGGGGGGFLYSPNKKKGEKGMNGDGSAFYVAPDTLDKGEKALADGEYEKWQKEKTPINRDYANFLDFGEAEKISPDSVKVGDNIITRYVTPQGERVQEKWTYLSPTGASRSRDYPGFDIKVTDVKTTAKTVTITGLSIYDTPVKKTFNKNALMFRRRKPDYPTIPLFRHDLTNRT